MKAFLCSLSFLCVTHVMAQAPVPVSTPVTASSPVTNNVQNPLIEQYKEAEKAKILSHRSVMHEKRMALKEQEEQLMRDVKTAKHMGDITNEQKALFISRHREIQDEHAKLRDENEAFKKSIQEDRLTFYRQLK